MENIFNAKQETNRNIKNKVRLKNYLLVQSKYILNKFALKPLPKICCLCFTPIYNVVVFTQFSLIINAIIKKLSTVFFKLIVLKMV